MFKASNSVRVFFFNIAVITMAGLWLSGFSNIHWFAYLLPSFLLVAAITGYCPGLSISRRILAVFGLKE